MANILQDGLRGASVRWDAFCRVANLTRLTFVRSLLRNLVHFTPVVLFAGIALLGTGAANNNLYAGSGDTYIGLGAVFLVFALVVTGLSPFIIKRIYGGKFWHTQVSHIQQK